MDQSLSLHPASPLLDRSPATLPSRAYRDGGWFGSERRLIWGRSWVYAGRSGDLPAKTVRRLSVAGQNLILVKDAAGALACFHNTCRHRGAELLSAADTRLKSKLIICPYHQWSYALDGRLVRTPFVSVTPDFRAEDHGLFAVHVREWRGFVFVCLADQPPPLEPAFDPEAIRRLKESSPADISVGGAELAGQAIDAGLVDECHLFLFPIAVGGGKRALPDGIRIWLELLDERRFDSGVVHLHYRVGGS